MVVRLPAYNKYSNVRTSGSASKAEAALHEYLAWREKAGEIRNLKPQQSVYLTNARIQYITDFGYEVLVTLDNRTQDWVPEWAEFKGLETPVWRIKRRLWMYYGPGPLVVYKGGARSLAQFEIIEPRKE